MHNHSQLPILIWLFQHITDYQILQKYQQQMRLPAIPDVIGSGDASGASDHSARDIEQKILDVKTLPPKMQNPTIPEQCKDSLLLNSVSRWNVSKV